DWRVTGAILVDSEHGTRTARAASHRGRAVQRPVARFQEPAVRIGPSGEVASAQDLITAAIFAQSKANLPARSNQESRRKAKRVEKREAPNFWQRAGDSSNTTGPTMNEPM